MSQLDIKHDAELERSVSDAIQAVSGDLRQISLDVSLSFSTLPNPHNTYDPLVAREYGNWHEGIPRTSNID